MTQKKAFTLIELLVVMSIIGILVGITGYTWASSSKRSRDNTRRADLERIRNTLQQYYLDNKTYPKFDTTGGTIFSAAYQLTDKGCGSSSMTKRVAPRYISTIPEDPLIKNACTNVTNNTNRYVYISTPTDVYTGPSAATGFALMANLEGDTYDYLVADGFSEYSWYKAKNEAITPVGNRAVADYIVTGSFGR